MLSLLVLELVALHLKSSTRLFFCLVLAMFSFLSFLSLRCSSCGEDPALED